MLVQLTYISRCSKPFNNDDAVEIIKVSKRNNPQLGITGVLCFVNGFFIQQIEGDRMAVNTLYRRIMMDDRHRELVIVEMADIIRRRFSTWSMGLLTDKEECHPIFLKYSSSAEFDPLNIANKTFHTFFDEISLNIKWLDDI